jgi:hypothetical protein
MFMSGRRIPASTRKIGVFSERRFFERAVVDRSAFATT